MANQSENVNLQKGDLVLMNFAGLSENGPVFEYVDKVGALDLEDEEDRVPQNSTLEHDASGSASSRQLDLKGLAEGASPQSLVSALEAQRDALDGVIQQMKRDATGAGKAPSPGVGRQIPPQLSQASNGSSKAQPRKLEKERDRSPTRH